MSKDQFPIRLHEARVMMGLSMDKLVERTGGAITKQSISRYEKGVMHPKRDAMTALTSALSISEAYFKGTNLKIDLPMLRTTSNGKLSDEGKICLKFDSATRADGWKDCSIFKKDDKYYLALEIGKGITKEETIRLQSNNTCKKMIYLQQKTGCDNLSRLFVYSKGTTEAPAVSQYGLPLYKIKKSIDKHRVLSQSQKKIYIQKHPKYVVNLVEYYKTGIRMHKDFKPFIEMLEKTWKPSCQYKSVKDFAEETEKCCYAINFRDCDFEYLLELQRQKKIMLFWIYNKDFSEGSKGTPNLHTMYWKEIFSPENLHDVIYKLSSQGIEFFYRKQIISKPFVHKQASVLVNKTYANGMHIAPNGYVAFVKYFGRENVDLTVEQIRQLPLVKTNTAKIDNLCIYY